jgi:hypothetical protein
VLRSRAAQANAHLRVLRQKTMLGASENDVAEYLLTQRLEQMLADKYHEKQVPPQPEIDLPEKI